MAGKALSKVPTTQCMFSGSFPPTPPNRTRIFPERFYQLVSRRVTQWPKQCILKANDYSLLYAGCGKSRFTGVKQILFLYYYLLVITLFYTNICKPKSCPFCPTPLPFLPLSTALFPVNLTVMCPHTQLLKIPGILKGFPVIVHAVLIMTASNAYQKCLVSVKNNQ